MSIAEAEQTGPNSSVMGKNNQGRTVGKAITDRIDGAIAAFPTGPNMSGIGKLPGTPSGRQLGDPPTTNDPGPRGRPAPPFRGTVRDTVLQDVAQSRNWTFDDLIDLMRMENQGMRFAVGRVGGGRGGEGFLFEREFAGHFAKGGRIPSRHFGVVGERGPELVTGPADVIPMGAGGGGQSVVEVRLGPGLEASILEQAGNQSVQITRSEITRFDKHVLPARVVNINANPRARG